MGSKIPPEIKSQIVHLWLGGNSRDKISHDIGLSGGAVSATVEEFKNELGVPTAHSLRTLARELKKLAITAPDSAKGARILNTLQRLSVNDDSAFESFVKELYNECIAAGLTPEKAVFYTKQLFEISKDNKFPPSFVAQFVNERQEQKRGLEEEIRKLDEQKMEAVRGIAATKESHKELLESIKDCVYAREEFAKAGIAISDIITVSKILNGCKALDFDLNKVIASLKKVESLEAQRADLELEINEYVSLVQENKELAKVINKMQSMNFDFTILDRLSNIFSKVAERRNTTYTIAASAFIVESKNYDEIQGYRKVLSEIHSEIQKAESSLKEQRAELESLETTYAMQKDAMGVITSLMGLGMRPKDFIYLGSIIKDNDNNIDITALARDVREHGEVKNALRILKESEGHLKQQVEIATNQLYEMQLEKDKVQADLDSSKKQFTVYTNETQKNTIETVKNTASSLTRQIIGVFTARKDLTIVSHLGSVYAPLVGAEYGDKELDREKLGTAVIQALKTLLPYLKEEDNSNTRTAITKCIKLLEEE